jgi:hypothetical protein
MAARFGLPAVGQFLPLLVPLRHFHPDVINDNYNYRSTTIIFTKCAMLVQDLLAAKRNLSLPKYIGRLGSFEGLIIDDIG